MRTRLLAVGLATMATACGDASGAPRAVPSATPRAVPQAAVAPAFEVAPYGAIRGVLHGDRDTGCLWLTSPSGSKTQLVVHGDFRVDFDDAGVVLYRGATVHGREGKEASFAGGLFPGAGVPGCPVLPENGEHWHGA